MFSLHTTFWQFLLWVHFSRIAHFEQIEGSILYLYTLLYLLLNTSEADYWGGLYPKKTYTSSAPPYWWYPGRDALSIFSLSGSIAQFTWNSRSSLPGEVIFAERRTQHWISIQEIASDRLSWVRNDNRLAVPLYTEIETKSGFVSFALTDETNRGFVSFVFLPQTL